tara:strand:- start:23956 stop:24225 length:270 start_codon:yes stop_codon:yes gene_type:complete
MDKIQEMIEARQAPGAIIRHPAGETRYISSLAKFPNDPRANVSSMTEAHRKAEAQGKTIGKVEDLLPGSRREFSAKKFSETFDTNWRKA